MLKLFTGFIIFTYISCITIYFQKYSALKGENITIIRSNKYNYGKLPDLIQDTFPNYKKFEHLPDIIVKYYFIIFVILLIYNNKLNSIGYHTLILLSMMFILRAILFSITILPSIQTDCHKEKRKHYNKDFLSLISDLITNKTGEFGYCNDYLFSGHSSIFIIISLVVTFYNLLPPLFLILLWVITMISTLIIIIGRNHYTIDIIIAYFFSIYIFNIYKKYM